MTDPIADMLTRIRNAYMAGKKTVSMPHSKMKESIANILTKNGYVSNVDVQKGESFKIILLTLKYPHNNPAISNIQRISKPGRRVYAKNNNLPRPLSGYGLAIVSTSQGIMSGKEAKQKNIGGELICKVW